MIDRAPLPPMEHPAFDGRAYAIAAGSRPLLEAGGVWEKLPFPASPILGIRVTDGRLGRPASRLRLGFDASEAPFGWMVEARSLRMALNARFAELEALSVFAPAEARVERGPEGALLVLADGREIAARLVVAAEGRTSPLARAARIPFTRFSYGQIGIVTAIAHERPHGNVALEHFLPAGPFAQLPMSATEEAEHVSAIVWTEGARLGERLFALDDARFGWEIARRLGGHLGGLRPLGRRFRYPLGAGVRASVRRCAAGAGGGRGARHPPDRGPGPQSRLPRRDRARFTYRGGGGGGWGSRAEAVLRRYQRQRRGDNLLMLAATDGLERLFSNDIPRSGWRATSGSPRSIGCRR